MSWLGFDDDGTAVPCAAVGGFCFFGEGGIGENGSVVGGGGLELLAELGGFVRGAEDGVEDGFGSFFARGLG